MDSTTHERFVLTAMVMAGDVYGAGSLPLNPPYSFQMVASTRRHVIFRDYLVGSPKADSSADHHEVFSDFKTYLSFLKRQPINVATLLSGRPWPLVAQLHATGKDGIKWLLDFPVNHLNHREIAGRVEFQIETGPVLIPAGLIDTRDVAVTDGFTLAYIFFNRLDRADLAIWSPLMPERASGRAFGQFHRLAAAAIELHAAAA